MVKLPYGDSVINCRSICAGSEKIMNSFVRQYYNYDEFCHLVSVNYQIQAVGNARQYFPCLERVCEERE